jgi:hypothetical protein
MGINVSDTVCQEIDMPDLAHQNLFDKILQLIMVCH